MRGFAQILMQRGEQGGLVRHQRVEQPLELRAAKLLRPGRAGMEKSPLAGNEWREIHIVLAAWRDGVWLGQVMIHKLALLMLATALLVRADDAVDKLTSAGIKEFSAAYQAWDGGRFGTAAELFRQACTKAPDSSVNFYWQGAARFHRLLQLRGQPESEANTKAAAAAMEGAVAALETAVKLDAQQAESHALLGTLYGMKINGSMLRAVRYGPSVAKHQKQALQFGAENPRVRYLLGTGLFHTAEDEAIAARGAGNPAGGGEIVRRRSQTPGQAV